MKVVLKSATALVVLCPLIASAQSWHVPAPGSRERAQVMTALRSELARFDPSVGDLRFRVGELCVSDRVGWIVAEPQSADGRNRYEPINASLKRRNGRWSVDALACSEEECPAGTWPDEIRQSINPACK